ncbi:MAG: hypothetical protein QY326_07950 [Bdellovibrionota bacterium]|nr:MAG: hypothetical protein QY326_07950 [Bdellovibrionota bacterium]
MKINPHNYFVLRGISAAGSRDAAALMGRILTCVRASSRSLQLPIVRQRVATTRRSPFGSSQQRSRC